MNAYSQRLSLLLLLAHIWPDVLCYRFYVIFIWLSSNECKLNRVYQYFFIVFSILMCRDVAVVSPTFLAPSNLTQNTH